MAIRYVVKSKDKKLKYEKVADALELKKGTVFKHNKLSVGIEVVSVIPTVAFHSGAAVTYKLLNLDKNGKLRYVMSEKNEDLADFVDKVKRDFTQIDPKSIKDSSVKDGKLDYTEIYKQAKSKIDPLFNEYEKVVEQIGRDIKSAGLSRNVYDFVYQHYLDLVTHYIKRPELFIIGLSKTTRQKNLYHNIRFVHFLAGACLDAVRYHTEDEQERQALKRLSDKLYIYIKKLESIIDKLIDIVETTKIGDCDIKDDEIDLDNDFSGIESEKVAKQGIIAELNTTNDYSDLIMRLKELYNKTQDEKYLNAANAIEDINKEEYAHAGEFSQILANLNPEISEDVQEGMGEVKNEEIEDACSIKDALGEGKCAPTCSNYISLVNNLAISFSRATDKDTPKAKQLLKQQVKSIEDQVYETEFQIKKFDEYWAKHKAEMLDNIQKAKTQLTSFIKQNNIKDTSIKDINYSEKANKEPNKPINDADKTCVICGKEITGYGNNAEPVKKGLCCDKCNKEKVIPARVAAMGAIMNKGLDSAPELNEKRYELEKEYTETQNTIENDRPQLINKIEPIMEKQAGHKLIAENEEEAGTEIRDGNDLGLDYNKIYEGSDGYYYKFLFMDGKARNLYRFIKYKFDELEEKIIRTGELRLTKDEVKRLKLK